MSIADVVWAKSSDTNIRCTIATSPHHAFDVNNICTERGVALDHSKKSQVYTNTLEERNAHHLPRFFSNASA